MNAAPNPLRRAAEKALDDGALTAVDKALVDPLFIVSAPRSGSTMLFRELARLPGFVTIGGESHGVFRAFPELRAENDALDSGALDASHADPETVALLRCAYALLLRDHHGAPLPLSTPAGSTVFLEKTPRQALNISFLNAAFPGARYLYLVRDARACIASLIEAWQTGLDTGRFVTFRDLPGWDRPGWCFLLPRGWRELRGKSLAEIATFQWCAANDAIVASLDGLPRERWTAVDYEAVVNDPAATLRSAAAYAGIDTDAVDLPSSLPLSPTTISPPAADKWRREEAAIEAFAARIAATEARIRELRRSG